MFLHQERIEIGGRLYGVEEVITRLSPYLTDERRARIEAVVSGRAYGLLPVLEGVHDMGNVNAVLRSAEGLGYGAVGLARLQGDAGAWAHARQEGAILGDIAGTGTAQRQSQGADKWLDLHVWPDVHTAATELRKHGYRIAATHLSSEAVPIEEVDFSIPTALVFGNEAHGVSEEMLAEADLNVILPIDGFVQSYNISVAAAMALYHARLARIARAGSHADLTPAHQHLLTARYYARSVRNVEALMSSV